jgi:hypothetical protein
MGDASYAQTSFLGGEISQWAQGRFDTPRYKIALAKGLNLIPVDEGAAPRRPGTQFLGTTLNGADGRVMPFDFSQATPYDLEFTDNCLRFWNGSQLVTSNDSQQVEAISNGTPAVFTIPSAVTWKTGDQCYFTFNSSFEAVAGSALLNRQFTLTMLTTTTFTITDAITGQTMAASQLSGGQSIGLFDFDGPISSGPISDDPISGAPSQRSIIKTLSTTVNHIAQVTTPYAVATNDWHSLRLVQGLDLALLLHTGVTPQALSVLLPPSDGEFATFQFEPAQFQDGPYLDPPAYAIATPNGTSGVIQITVSYPAWVSSTVYGYGVPVTFNGQDYISIANNNYNIAPGSNTQNWQVLPLGSAISAEGFVSTDVGRMIRLFSAPLQWSSGTTYAAGTNVTYNGEYFTSLQNSNTNNEPDISTTYWVINTSAAIYTWGVITAVNAPNNVSLQINGSGLLYSTPCPSFQIGAWSDTTGWPTCGCYSGGRFWFAGAIPNRVDSSSSNQPFIMSPTQQDGTVIDSNGISYTFNSNSLDEIFWMTGITGGILVGTQRGEILLTSGTSGGPITPSSITESPTTKYGSENILPVHTGLTTCFVQRQGRRLLEYLADVFSQRFYGPDLTTFARHIGGRGFEEIAYQQEPAPIVWGRMSDGSLVGTTYRRISLFSNQEPEFNAWHEHQLGSGRLVESICVGPSNGGTLDTLTMVTNDPATNIHYVESLTTMLDETDPYTQSWFLDCAVTPQAATITNGSVVFLGLNYLNGKKVSVFAAGLDCGDFIVENGQVSVPLGTADNISGYTFDIPQFNLLQPLSNDFASVNVVVVAPDTTYNIPCVIGFNYQTQGQLCRPMLPPDTGARNGPGFGKKRRTARYAASLVNSIGVQVGSSFSGKMHPMKLTTPGGKTLPYLSPFTGIVRDTLENDFSFDSMLCWQTTRPFPATMTAFGGFLTTEDV